MAILRIPRASVPTGADGGPDLTSILQRLAPAGGLAKAAGKLSGSADLGNAGTGLAGLLSLARGVSQQDPGQAVGGALNVGSGIAGLADYPGVSSVLGGLGGPLTFATGLAKGDPLSSTIGGVQTASALSGYFGGPTLSGLVAPALEAGYMALPGASAEGLAALGLGGGVGLAGGLALAPIGIALGGALTSFLEKDALHEAKQIREYGDYSHDFPGLAKRRAQGAGLYDHLGEDMTPEELTQAFETAASGEHANVAPAAYNLSHQPTYTTIKPMDLSAWDAKSPEMGGHNAAAFLNLFDQAEGAGLDPGGKTGQWNLQPADWATSGEAGVGPDDANRTGDDYRTKIGYNNQAQMQDVINPATGQYEAQWTGGARGQTQEAQDLGNSVAGLGQHLGIDWTKRGEGDYQNFDQDQLAGYGFTPGHYGAASLNYLRSFDPSVTERPEWEGYAKALDPNNELAGLQALTLTPRKPITYAYSPNLGLLDQNLGGA